MKMHLVRLPLTFVSSLLSCASLMAQPSATNLTFLDNGAVRIGMDLSLGGAVTFLASRDHPSNIINSADLGRQIQMSHYSGPWPFEPGGKRPHKAWAGLGWNPIQTGDCYNNPSRVLEHRNSGAEIYIKCIPMQWPLNNVPGDCVFETWTTLEGPLVHMRFRCTNQRADRTVYRACAQELPAVYTVSTLSRLMSYVGDKPFTGGALTRVTNHWRDAWPWTRFVATEGWAALVNDRDWGLGVFKADAGEFHGGVYGDERSSDPRHGSTAYIAPIHVENFDHNIVYEHRTEVMLGNLSEIRARFNQLARKEPPAWRFDQDRQHWTLSDAADAGFPLRGEWRVKFGSEKPRLESGIRCWRAEDAPFIDLDIACPGPPQRGRLLWQRLDKPGYEATRSVEFSLPAGGDYRKVRLDLGTSPEYRGLITGLALEPADKKAPGLEWALRSIVLSARRD